MQCHDGFDNRQSQAGTRLMSRRIDTIKAVENLGKMFRRNAASGVFHPDFHTIPVPLSDDN